jgi:hypothetical protein
MPLITPLEDLLTVAPQRAAEPATEPASPGFWDTAAAALRQQSSVTTLYERGMNEHSLPFQSNFEITPQDGYDPYPELQQSEFSDDPRALAALMRAESPEELQFLKERIRQEQRDRGVIDSAGGWGLASSMAAGLTDPFVLASMAIPVAPVIAGASRATRVIAGVAAQAAVDSAAEGVLHSGQELRTIGESAFNVGAGALLSGVLGTIATRVPKGEFEATRRALQEEIARATGVELPTRAVNQAAEGMDSFGSARAVDTSLEDEGIARGGNWLGKSLGRVSLLTRTLTKPFKSARVLSQRLVEVPYRIAKNMKGIATPVSVESIAKDIVNRGRHEATKMLDESFLEFKRSGGTLTRKQFSAEVANAMDNADVSPIPQVAKAAAWGRKVFEEDKAFFKQYGVEFGDEVVGAKSYFPRVYDFEKIWANLDDFEARLFKWFKENPKVKVTKGVDGAEDTVEPIILEDAEIMDAVAKTVDRIMGLPGSRADLNLRSKGAPMKERVLDVPNEVLAPYLERDFESVMSGYFRAMAPEIGFRKAGFSSPEMKLEIDEITDEYHRLRAQATAAGDRKKVTSLTDAHTEAVEDLKRMRDRLLGNVGPRGARHAGWVRLGRTLRTYNYVRLLGSQTLSSMSDVHKLVARYGLMNTISDTARFLSNSNLRHLSQENSHRIGTALQILVDDSRTQTLAELADELPRTRFDKGMQRVSNAFSKLTLMSQWNASIQHLTVLMEQDAIIRAATRGKRIDIARLAEQGFEADEVAAIAKFTAEHGEDMGGITRMRTELWPDQALARKVERSISKVADQMITVKGLGDLPMVMDSELGKTVLQFRSFALASINRTMIPLAQGLVGGDLSRTAQGISTALAMGAMTYYVKERVAGREPDLSHDRLLAEALSWSGMLGIVPDLWDLMAAGAGDDEEGNSKIGRFSRFKSRSPTETWLGPTIGTGGQMALDWTSNMLTGGIDQKDVERTRRLLPFQNVFWLRQLFNAVEGEIGEAINAEGSTTRDFTDRLTEMKPTT